MRAGTCGLRPVSYVMPRTGRPRPPLSLRFPLQAYMEDHLKNKNRLEKEWEALCVYQAEPNSSLVAQREENVPKNRSPAVLTCTYRALLWAGEGNSGRAGPAAPSPACLGFYGCSWLGSRPQPGDRVDGFFCGPGARSWFEGVWAPVNTCRLPCCCAVGDSFLSLVEPPLRLTAILLSSWKALSPEDSRCCGPGVGEGPQMPTSLPRAETASRRARSLRRSAPGSGHRERPAL